MTAFVTGIIGMALVVIFMGFLGAWLKAVPMIVIMLIVAALMVYDFRITMRESASGPYRRK